MQYEKRSIENAKEISIPDTVIIDFKNKLAWDLTSGHIRIMHELNSEIDIMMAVKFLLNDIAYQTIEIVTGSKPDEAYVKEIVWNLMLLNNLIVLPDANLYNRLVDMVNHNQLELQF